ncbi:unnamed protein product [Rotaria magnacalcarata]|uniref:Uncharacterized protein n=2 Tax=Rotaria magnacalcarata TaxID=392030 RepID=A0A8S2VV21_9BILA|nr:unnamed protein product [Rotaria magnacalcarata]
MATQDAEVYCSFCNEGFVSPKAMGTHLMMCGNKTDQCPKCRRYIRRAIFAYHYENDCANPDAPTRDNETNKKTQNFARSNNPEYDARIPCEYCNQGIPWHLYDNHTRTCRNEHNKRPNEQIRPSLSSVGLQDEPSSYGKSLIDFKPVICLP